MNYTARHSYYVRRTCQWLEGIGYRSDKVETNYCIQVAGRSVFVKRDFWGADIAARCRTSMAFIQIKTGRNQVNKGVSQLSSDNDWPPGVGRYVIWWDKGERLSVGPNVWAVSEGACQKIRDAAKTYRVHG